MMRRVIKTKTFVAVALVTLAAWAASYGYGAARNYFGSARRVVPAPASFREVEGRGLLVKTWVNGAGAYTFAIDTGAGATIISERVAREARVAIRRDATVSISGLSGASNSTGREATLRELAIGYQANLLPAHATVIVTGGLPPDIDGVLDPTESFAPLGYVIDLPKSEISAFDPRTSPVRMSDATPGGAVVPWVFQAGSKRPFVTLEGGRRALIDTGSGFGLAVNDEGARALGLVPRAGGRERNGVRDLGGGQVAARRIAPATIMIGELELRRVPTDLISSERGAPILLGRDALAPFRLTFDPLNRLIQISPQ